MERVYVIASLSRFGPNKPGWVMKDRSISKSEDGAISFPTADEAEAQMKEWNIPMGHVIRFG
jgi:hypothetical protein